MVLVGAEGRNMSMGCGRSGKGVKDEHEMC